MNRYKILISIIATIVVYVLLKYIIYSIALSRMGSIHKYNIECNCDYLTEEQAIDVSKRALLDEGYDLNSWNMSENVLYSIKNNNDKYLQRINSTEGMVEYTNKYGNAKCRTVHIILNSKEISAQILKGD